jgi:hypothetical protein
MRIRFRTARLLPALLICIAGLTVQGCRESEQDRILFYEKGKYLGKPDKELSAAQREQLRQRARTAQQF